MMARALRGHVTTLSVTPVPDAIKTYFGIETERFPARPKGLEVIVPQYDLRVAGEAWSCATLGGRREVIDGAEDATTADRLFRRVVTEAPDDATRKVGAIGHAIDAAFLGEIDNLKIRHFGNGHSAAGIFADRDLLVVRRFQRPESAVAIDAAVLRMVTHDVVPAPEGGRVAECRRHGSDAVQISVRVSADPIAREIMWFDDRYYLLNAIERVRLLSAATRGEAKRVVVLDGTPRDWFSIRPVVGTPEGLGARVGLDLTKLQPDRESAGCRARDA